MSEVAEVLELARRHGVLVEARGDELRLRAATAPPLDVVDALRLHKPQIMAALATASPGVPQEWVDGVSRLLGTPHPEGMAPESWMLFLGSCESFIASPWPGKAASMGWDAYALFGCHNLKPVERVDRMGLLWLLRGGRIAALTSGTAVIEMPSGSRLTYRTNPIREPSDVLAWELS
ncbi:MAG: hypothetical protein O7A66_09020 [Alphaproteobacteria bacterium]|nr:hypothetical protein [Alphaproteobacteria bacterium]